MGFNGEGLEMGEVFGTIAFIFICMFVFYSGSSCQRDMWREETIGAKGFCLESKVSGQEFKKCYELKEIQEGE